MRDYRYYKIDDSIRMQERKVIIISTVRCNAEFLGFDMKHKLGKEELSIMD